MYQSFFGIAGNPFSVAPEANCLFRTHQHRAALAMLEYGINKRSLFSLITGDIGTGKTTLVRTSLLRLADSIVVGVLSSTHRSFEELLQWTAQAFALDPEGRGKVQLLGLLTDYFLQEFLQKRRVVLVVDEAQNLSIEALEELRMLSNINADRHRLLHIVLIGHTRLREMLRSAPLQPLAQRIDSDFHLRPLTREDVAAYVQYRLRRAGFTGKELFDASACLAIHRLTGGVPRLVNIVCDAALVHAFVSGRRIITGPVIEETDRNKRELGGWLFTVPGPTPPTQSAARPTPRELTG